jgi:predicted phosphodiesterase
MYAISDLHLEFRPGGVSEFYESLHLPKANVLILAGDVGHAGSAAYREFLTLAKQHYPEVVVVPGNHEYYKTGLAGLETLRQECEKHGVHLLQQSSKQLFGVWFHGVTLWSAIDSDIRTNDFQHVFRDRVDYLEQFIQDFQWLRNTLATKKDEEHHVVITHHLPTHRLIHSRYRGSRANTGFATDLLDHLNLRGVSHWFCGHTHEHARDTLRHTTFVVNPVGYPKEPRQTSISSEVFLSPLWE